ncbi:MAG: hypothetical protein LBU16_08710, partial [Treponema sp.]|nr:hypothetical protein [Treponema sp.]
MSDLERPFRMGRLFFWWIGGGGGLCPNIFYHADSLTPLVIHFTISDKTVLTVKLYYAFIVLYVGIYGKESASKKLTVT